jgi:hypothetical protein
MGWEWDSWDSGLWRKNQGFLLPSWVFYGKQVCGIYVDQQTLAFPAVLSLSPVAYGIQKYSHTCFCKILGISNG